MSGIAEHAAANEEAQDMKKMLGLTIVGLMMVVTVPTSAGRARQVTETYSKPAAGAYLGPIQTGAWYYDCLEGTGCVRVPLRRNELTAAIVVDDAAGAPVAVKVYSFGGDRIAEFCTESGAIPVAGIGELLIMVVNGACTDGQPSVVTTGEVHVTLTR